MQFLDSIHDYMKLVPLNSVVIDFTKHLIYFVLDFFFLGNAGTMLAGKHTSGRYVILIMLAVDILPCVL